MAKKIEFTDEEYKLLREAFDKLTNEGRVDSFFFLGREERVVELAEKILNLEDSEG